MASISPVEFLRQVRQEVGKVTWPTRRETFQTTAMVFLMVILAALSLAGGWWAAPQLTGGVNYFDHFLAPALVAGSGAAEAGTGGLLSAAFAPPVIAALLGFLLAWWLYIRKPDAPARLAESLHGAYRVLVGKYFIDDLYAFAIVRPLVWVSTNVLWHAVDEESIDGLVNGVGHEAGELGDRLRHLNSGNTRSYAAWVVLGAVLLTTLLAWAVR